MSAQKITALVLISLTSAACSVTNAYVYPKSVQDKYLITTGDIDCPYESAGYLQVSRSGSNLFGFLSVVDADLQKMFGELLIPELERTKADGVINMQFWERQWTTAAKIPFAFPLFFIPLPTYVEVTGELVRIPPDVRASCRTIPPESEPASPGPVNTPESALEDPSVATPPPESTDGSSPDP